jgi:hypothetical protein
MHLDERLEKSREALGKQFAVGQAKVSSAYNKLWADMEAMRKAQRERQEEQRLAQEKEAKEASTSTLSPLTVITPPDSHQVNPPQPKPPRPRPAQVPTSRHGARGPAKSARAGGRHAARQQHTCPCRLHRRAQARCPATSSAQKTSGGMAAWMKRVVRGLRCRMTIASVGTGLVLCFSTSRRITPGRSSIVWCSVAYGIRLDIRRKARYHVDSTLQH